jgi:hypothetical protein
VISASVGPNVACSRNRITSGLDKRSERIASDLEEGRKAAEKAGVVLAEYDQKIREGKREAARIIEEARTEASRLRESILQLSHEEARAQRPWQEAACEGRREQDLALRQEHIGSRPLANLVALVEEEHFVGAGAGEFLLIDLPPCCLVAQHRLAGGKAALGDGDAPKSVGRDWLDRLEAELMRALARQNQTQAQPFEGGARHGLLERRSQARLVEGEAEG